MYYFYYRKDRGGFKLEKVKSDKAIVFQEDCVPRIQFYQSEFENELWYIIGLPSRSKIEIFVPPGSILNSFKLELA